VAVAVAVCVAVPSLPLLLVGFANADPDANMNAIAVAKVLLLIEISPVIVARKKNLEPSWPRIILSRGPPTDYYSAISVPPVRSTQGADTAGVASRRETPIALRE
jgi:hypothetical protein